MATSTEHHRPVLVQAARNLIRASRRERAAHPAGWALRDFYLGVEAAAQEVVHPELTAARPPDWPYRESTTFQDGYLRTQAMLAAAALAPEPPLQLALPEPPAAPTETS